MSTEHDIERDLAAADRYPPSTLTGLDLDLAREELRREITATPRRGTVSWQGSRRPRWVPAVAAAAAVAAVVTGGLALRGDDRQSGGPAATPSTGPTAGPTAAHTPDRTGGLAPTADNLHQVVLEVPGWTLTSVVDDSTYGGSLGWEHGAEAVELTWSPADQYDSYLRDRQQVGPERAVSALGQDGKGFSYGRFDQPPANGTVVVDPTADPNPDDPDVPDLTRWQALFPPTGDWFLEVDVRLHDGSAIRPMLARLTRVDRDAWLAHLATADTVVPDAGSTFLAEAGRGVPLPPGVTVTVEDLRLPQDGYQARAAYVVPVLCGWARELRDARASGDAGTEQQAVAALEGSADWPVVRAMRRSGDFPQVFAASVRKLVGGTPTDLAAAWGCATPTG